MGIEGRSIKSYLPNKVNGFKILHYITYF